MNGTIIHQVIAVDYWRVRGCQARLYFLSHMHADHTQGLTPSWNTPIYCSEVSARLLAHKFQIRSDLIKALELDRSHLIRLDETGEHMVTVTLIDASHCPGAVMFLFQGYFGTILYTGDFRYEPESWVDSSLHAVLEGKTIEVLYLDNTYCEPSCEFPSRSAGTHMIIDLINKHAELNVVLGMRTLGKEQLLVALALHFKTRVILNDAQMGTGKVLGLPDVFTTDADKGFIQVIPLHSISGEYARSKPQTLFILPTALYAGLKPYEQPFRNCENVFIVPYSDHSSCAELHNFVKLIHPKKILPVVRANARGALGTSLRNRADMSCFDRYLNNEPEFEFEIPKAIRTVLQGGSKPYRKVGKWKKPMPFFSSKRRKALGLVFDDDDDDDTCGDEKVNDCDSPNLDEVEADGIKGQAIKQISPAPATDTLPDQVLFHIFNRPGDLSDTGDDVTLSTDEDTHLKIQNIIDNLLVTDSDSEVRKEEHSNLPKASHTTPSDVLFDIPINSIVTRESDADRAISDCITPHNICNDTSLNLVTERNITPPLKSRDDLQGTKSDVSMDTSKGCEVVVQSSLENNCSSFVKGANDRHECEKPDVLSSSSEQMNMKESQRADSVTNMPMMPEVLPTKDSLPLLGKSVGVNCDVSWENADGCDSDTSAEYKTCSSPHGTDTSASSDQSSPCDDAVVMDVDDSASVSSSDTHTMVPQFTTAMTNSVVLQDISNQTQIRRSSQSSHYEQLPVSQSIVHGLSQGGGDADHHARRISGFCSCITQHKPGCNRFSNTSHIPACRRHSKLSPTPYVRSPIDNSKQSWIKLEHGSTRLCPDDDTIDHLINGERVASPRSYSRGRNTNLQLRMSNLEWKNTKTDSYTFTTGGAYDGPSSCHSRERSASVSSPRSTDSSDSTRFLRALNPEDSVLDQLVNQESSHNMPWYKSRRCTPKSSR